MEALAALESGAAEDWNEGEGVLRRADFADAVRLQIDCMQQELSPAQRAALHRLLESLEAPAAPDAVAITAAARRVSALLGAAGKRPRARGLDRTD
jgi:hypothetical protein